VVCWAASSKNEGKKCESTNIASCWLKHAIREERVNNAPLTAILSDHKNATGRLKTAAGGVSPLFPQFNDLRQSRRNFFQTA
jgi:hypothetical protein